jgi:uncharacterized protein YqfB (UPF0267 family)
MNIDKAHSSVLIFSLYNPAGLWYNRSGGCVMEIPLPEVQTYIDKIKSGSITDIRLPEIKIETGSVLIAFSRAGDNSVIKLKVLSSETVPLESITAEEAEKEGFAVPDFCTSQFLCGNIETRLDFEDYAFKYENGVPLAQTQEEREILLREKVQRLCPSCVTKKNAKDQFLNYWKSKAVDGNMTKIKFEVLAN